jgi:hypothetical protein
MNPKAKGEKTEAIVIAELVRRDYKVLLPFGDNQRYDLLLDTEQGFKRVQCKTGQLRKGVIVFSVRSVQSNTKKTYVKNYRGQIELFAVYCYETNSVYLIPIDKLVGNTTGKLRVEPKVGIGGKKSMYAEDYRLL